MTLLPARFLPYAKAWVSLLAALVTTVIATVPDVPSWLAVIPAALGTLGVYLTPNADPLGTHQDEWTQPPEGDLEVIPASEATSDTKADAAGYEPKHAE